jgi:hypothetical protein
MTLCTVADLLEIIIMSHSTWKENILSEVAFPLSWWWLQTTAISRYDIIDNKKTCKINNGVFSPSARIWFYTAIVFVFEYRK